MSEDNKAGKNEDQDRQKAIDRIQAIENKIPTRQSFGEALAELGENDENIVVLDSDLSGATKTNIFAKRF